MISPQRVVKPIAVAARFFGTLSVGTSTMQMALILVLSSTLGAAPVFRYAVARLSRLPRTRHQVFALPSRL